MWFYVENSQITEHDIRITGADVNHIRNVLRMKQGDHLTICDGEGTDYQCQIESLTPGEVVARIVEMGQNETELPARIYLFQGLPKKDKMELIIQKAVELGVYEIIPVAMKRCVVKLEDPKKEQKKLGRWQTIADSAAKQCGRGILPKVKEVMTLEQAAEYASGLSKRLVPYELAQGMAQSHRAVKEAAKASSVGVFIGPEGGFDQAEMDMLLKKDAEPITLGRRILRTETAGLTALSILMFEMEGMGENEYGSLS